MPAGKIDSVLDIHPLEFARQLALMEFESFAKIKPTECYNLAWSKKDSSTKAPNIGKFIHRFNKERSLLSLHLICTDGAMGYNKCTWL